MALGQVKSVYLTAGLRAKGRESNDAQIIRALSFGVASCVQLAARGERAFAESPDCVPGSLQFSVTARWALVAFSLQVRTSEAQGD